MDHAKQEPRSLIMCTTPLQMLIAEKIIQLKKNEKFDLILIVNGSSNNKFKNYFNRLKLKTSKSMIYELNNISKMGKIKKFLEFKKDYRKWSDFNYSSYYLASIDNNFFHWIITNKIENSSIYTFDDGIANIYDGSSYFNEKKFLLNKFIWKILGVDYSLNKIKNQSKIHYTIYLNRENIINNKEYISLFSKSNLKVKNQNMKEEVNLFLGQPLYEVNNNYNKDYIIYILERFGIDVYFPHPRENYNLENKIKVIKSDCVFEDYVVNLSTEYKKINIYTFFSTAALNVEGIPNVEIYCLTDDFLKEKYRGLYKLFDTNFNLNLINVE